MRPSQICYTESINLTANIADTENLANCVNWALQHANYVTIISLTFTDIHDLRNKLNGYKNWAGQHSDYFVALRFSHASEPGNNHFRSDRLPCVGRLYGHPITGLSWDNTVTAHSWVTTCVGVTGLHWTERIALLCIQKQNIAQASQTLRFDHP